MCSCSPLHSRLENGFVDLKDAVKWQMSAMIIASAPGNTAKFSPAQCDFGFLLLYHTWAGWTSCSAATTTSAINKLTRMAAKGAVGTGRCLMSGEVLCDVLCVWNTEQRAVGSPRCRNSYACNQIWAVSRKKNNKHGEEQNRKQQTNTADKQTGWE